MLNGYEGDEYMKFTCEFLDTIDVIRSIRTCRGPADSMMDIERNYRDTYKKYCKNREAEGTLPEVVKREDDTFDFIFNCMDEYEFGDYVKDRYKISYTEESIVTTVWNN